ncbi:MAG: ArsR family transcriptional regulator [Clostridia bacterium]|jgi:ArsR family transcriptional regulator|nr:ArsR family transcriptional regulator [Clostridia bacterium]
MKYSYTEYVPMFKALADETRLKIIHMLYEGELCACKILENFNITQPTLSYHMKMLTESGLVHGKREGAWMKYNLDYDRINELRDVLNLEKRG